MPSYVITLLCHYSTSIVEGGSYWKFIGPIGQASLVLCCLDSKKVVGSNDTFVLINLCLNVYLVGGQVPTRILPWEP